MTPPRFCLWLALLCAATGAPAAEPPVYANPLVLQRADPWVYRHSDGYYYFMGTVPEYDRLELRRAKTLQALGGAEANTIWTKHATGAMGSHIWAPEIHFINDKWYVYFAAGAAEKVWDIRIYVLENSSANPLEGEWIEKGQLNTGWESFALDATTFEHKGVNYLLWAQKDPKIRGNTNLYLAKMDTPWSITGAAVMLSRPEFPWEQVRYWVNEGPAVIKHKGHIFITYSAAGTGAEYCLGMLEARDDADLLDPKSWTKAPQPVFATFEHNGVFGPGHNSFTTDGKSDILVYHARSYREIKGDPLHDANRSTRAQAIHWNNNGTPDFGVPLPAAGFTEPVGPSAVVPVAWDKFTAPYPADTDAQRMRAILQHAVKHALTIWWHDRAYDQQDDAPYLEFTHAKGKNSEQSIRPPAEQAYALAVALRLGLYDAAAIGVPAATAEGKALKLIRSVAYRHKANSPGGWGDHWQSAAWTGWAAHAAWLLWDRLPETDRTYVERMVAYEADRFIDYAVPYYRDPSGKLIFPGDTKSEENAWNCSVLNVAVNMMPGHPHHDAWLRKSVELMVSTYARPSDVTRPDVINGKPLATWLHGSNSNEDGSLVNHHLIHPDYMVAGLIEYNPAPLFALARQPVPAAAFFNVDRTYAALTDLAFTPGPTPGDGAAANLPPGGTIYRPGSAELYYPQGNDWGTSRIMNFVFADALVHALKLDGHSTVKAAEWEKLHATAALAMQARFTDGRTYATEVEDKFHSRDGWIALRAAASCQVKWMMAQGGITVTDRTY
ncbi:MAG: glycoside hydrolase family 43 protein [Lacunisphaera sp.]|nr:glycoside hydrolase family 43 protein [Lacunisphaera sp.]